MSSGVVYCIVFLIVAFALCEVFGSIVFATLDFLFGSRSPHLRLVELRCYLAGRIVPFAGYWCHPWICLVGV